MAQHIWISCTKIFPRGYNVKISSPREVFLEIAVAEQMYLSDIVLNKRAARLASYNYFTINVKQYKNTSISQLYQPLRTPFLPNTYQ